MSKIALRRYNAEINDMIDQEQAEEAIAHCLHILNTFPKYVETYRLLGKAYLESKQYKNAADVFQRVLSSHPDDFVSNIGMSIIGESNADYDSAIHHMERAFEEQPSNHAIQEEMKRLFGLRDGVEPTKVRLTRGALARMYVHGNLYDQAVAELLSIINESPQRLDLLTILAETYFIQNLNTEAADTCMAVLNDLPYCYLANRIMYQILIQDDRSEQAQEYFTRWIELDPYAEFISPPAYKSEDVVDNSLELDRLEQKMTLPPIDEKLFTTEILEEKEEESVIDEKVVDVVDESVITPEVLKTADVDDAIDAGDEIPDWLFGEEEEALDEIEEPAADEEDEKENFGDLFESKGDEVRYKAEIPSDSDEIKPEEIESEMGEEEDWLSSLEKDSGEEKDTWPSLLNNADKPAVNTGSLKLEGDENLDWLADLAEDSEEDERPDWEKITDTVPSIKEEEKEDIEEIIDADIFSKAEEAIEEEESIITLMEGKEVLQEDQEEDERDVLEETETDDEVVSMVSDEQFEEEESKDEFGKLEKEADEAWLNSLSETMKEEEKEDVQMPDWLKQIDGDKGLEKGAPIGQEAAEEISSLPEDDLPEWLKELKEEEFGERSAVDALIKEGEKAQVFLEDEPEKAEAESKESIEQELFIEDDLIPEIKSLEEELPDEAEVPEWMRALKGVADDIPGAIKQSEPVTEILSEPIESFEEDLQFDLEDQADLVKDEEEVADEDSVEEDFIVEDVEIKPADDSDWVPEISEIKVKEETSIQDEVSEEKEVDMETEFETSPIDDEPSELGWADEVEKLFQDGDVNVVADKIKKLIRKGKNLPEIVEALEKGLVTFPIEVSLWQLLGDAFMRQDRLTDAMEAYTNAEELIR